MLDELDSFLPDRTNATRHWEVTQANQFLTAMEYHIGAGFIYSYTWCEK